MTAIRSFFHFAAYEEPSHSSQIQRVLAIPSKRQTHRLVHYLDQPEIDALLAAPDQRTWFGRRDHALLQVAIQTGQRLSELAGLRRHDVAFATGAHVRCVGNGRKERCTPLTKTSVAILKAWLREPARHHADTLFPSACGISMILTPEQIPGLRIRTCLSTVVGYSAASGATIQP